MAQPVNRGGVDPVHAALDGMPHRCDGSRVVLRSPTKGPAAAARRPRAESHRRQCQAARSKRSRRKCHDVHDIPARIASTFRVRCANLGGDRMTSRLFLAITMFLGAVVSAQSPAQPAAAPAASNTQSPAAAGPAASCSEMATALTALLGRDTRMRDWAEMARYRDANKTLAAPALTDARVVFMGDSITDGWQQLRYGGFFPGKPYVDRGISGQTTPQMLIRFRRDVIDLQPKAVVILAGTNDIAGNTGSMTNEEIQGNLASMSDLAHAHNIKVVFSSITPVSEYHVRGVPQTTARPMDRIKAMNEWM